jgi:hypothetical protein
LDVAARLARAGRVTGNSDAVRRLDLALLAERDPSPGLQF